MLDSIRAHNRISDDVDVQVSLGRQRFVKYTESTKISITSYDNRNVSKVVEKVSRFPFVITNGHTRRVFG